MPIAILRMIREIMSRALILSRGHSKGVHDNCSKEELYIRKRERKPLSRSESWRKVWYNGSTVVERRRVVCPHTHCSATPQFSHHAIVLTVVSFYCQLYERCMLHDLRLNREQGGEKYAPNSANRSYLSLTWNKLWSDFCNCFRVENFDPIAVRVLDECYAFHFPWKQIILQLKVRIL